MISLNKPKKQTNERTSNYLPLSRRNTWRLGGTIRFPRVYQKLVVFLRCDAKTSSSEKNTPKLTLVATNTYNLTTTIMGLQNVVYNTIFKRTGPYVIFVLGGAVVTEKAIDQGIDRLWEKHNKGKLFKDIEPELRAKGLLMEGDN